MLCKQTCFIITPHYCSDAIPVTHMMRWQSFSCLEITG